MLPEPCVGGSSQVDGEARVEGVRGALIRVTPGGTGSWRSHLLRVESGVQTVEKQKRWTQKFEPATN